MKDELHVQYLLPKTLFHNFRKYLSSNQQQELDRANMTYLQEPQASDIPPAGNTTDTFIDTSILPSPPPKAPNPPVEPPRPPVEPPRPPVEPPKPPVEPPKPPVEPAKPPAPPPHAADLTAEPEHRNGWYTCPICEKNLHGKKKYDEHMLSHSSTPLPRVKPAAKTPKNIRVEMVNKQPEEEKSGFLPYMKGLLI